MSQHTYKLFSFSLFLKLCLALITPVTLDEYYYFLWGQYLSLSYFDHPPMVGWIMSLSQPFVDIGEGAIRWPFVLMSHGTLFTWYLILKNELKEKWLFWFFLTALFNPLWGLGGFIATPDIPLLFFWSLSLFFVKKLLAEKSLSNYLLFGLSLGLGFVSKYQIVLFIPALIWLIVQRKMYDRLLSLKTLLAVVLALLACSPVILWNANHDWASFVFQWKHGMSSQAWSWKYPLDYVFSQIFLIFPTFLVFFFLKNKGWKQHWLLPFSLFPLLFFAYSSFKGRVEGNWAIMAFPATYALAYIFVTEKTWPWMRRTNWLWIFLVSLVCCLLPFKKSIPHQKIKLFESEKYENVLNSLKQDKTYLAYSYQLASLLSFKSKRLICKFNQYGRIDHFNYLKPCKKIPDQFTLLTVVDAKMNLQEDLPDFEVISTKEIDSQFVAIEVQKR